MSYYRPLPKYFTYSLPDECAEEVEIGCRVIVPFGRKKFYTAIVRNVHYCAPTEYEVKDISALLDASPKIGIIFYNRFTLQLQTGRKCRFINVSLCTEIVI